MSGECEHCSAPLDARAVVLSGGAYRLLAPEAWGPGSDPSRPVFEVFGTREAVGWLELACSDEAAPAEVRIIDHDGTCGTFDLHFCSPTCLRSFFGAQVDALEAEIARTRERERSV